MRQNITASIVDIIGTFGKRTALIITSSDFEMFHKKAQSISDALVRAGIGCMIYDKLPKEPNTEDIDEAVHFIKGANCSSIIGFGGIESINSAKAISILINNYVFCNDIFSQTLPNDPVNLVAIPAFPVFGFEINPFFYMADITENEKHVFFDRR
ncbi:MAG: iron-containing alcohol dehydrogenase, partial [Leptospirales bacterium]|nr:iron-containing alcohol dehydrogenase [Leptospirales bacterium]